MIKEELEKAKTEMSLECSSNKPKASKLFYQEQEPFLMKECNKRSRETQQ